MDRVHPGSCASHTQTSSRGTRALSVFVLAIALASLSGPLSADPVSGRVLKDTQPDGTVLQFRVWGDEFYHVAETLDGYTVVGDENTRWICYAKLSADGAQLLSTGAKVGVDDPAKLGVQKNLRITPAARAQIVTTKRLAMGRAAKPTPPPRTTVGTFIGLLLIVDFPDRPFTVAKQEIDDWANKAGYSNFGNNGSVRDYYKDVSVSKCDFQNRVYGYYRAQNNFAHYQGLSNGAAQLVVEALNSLQGQIGNFSVFSHDAGNNIYATSCLYSGDRPAVWASPMWPHSSSLSGEGESFSSGGINVDNYQISDISNTLVLGTFCHECGHMLCGYDDYYPYTGTGEGIAEWCLMSSGNYNGTPAGTNPAPIHAYLRMKSGWLAPTPMAPTLHSINCTLDEAIIYQNPSQSTEYFMLSGMQKVGRYAGMPGEGLVIFHIDESGDKNNSQHTAAAHYESSVVQADNQYDLELGRNRGDAQDPFSASTNPNFDDTTSPNAHWWSGTPSGLIVQSIGAAGGPTITFNPIKGPPPTLLSVSPTSGTIDGGTTVTVSGADFQAGAMVSFGGTAAVSVQVVSATVITCITRPHAAGPVDVTVTNPDGQSGTLSNAYTFTPPPRIQSISPNTGPITGGTAVTIRGSGFVVGATVSFGGLFASSVVVVNDSMITCVTPPHSAGPVNVVVTNPDGTAGTKTYGFTYKPPPTLTSVTPNTGKTAGNETVTITGTNFLTGVKVSFGGVDVLSVTIVGNTTLRVQTPPHAGGVVDVAVTNPDGQISALLGAYTYIPPPTLLAVDPANGIAEGGTTVVLHGLDFGADATQMTLNFGGSVANIITVDSLNGTIVCVTSGHEMGAVDVTLTNPDGQKGTLVKGYTYLGTPPKIDSSLDLAAVVNKPFSYSFAMRGARPITLAITPSLPAGLVLTQETDAAPATISGTPTQVGNFVMSVTASNSIGTLPPAGAADLQLRMTVAGELILNDRTAPPTASTSILIGDPLLLIASTTDSLGNPMSYTWNFGDGSSPETGVTVKHTYLAEGVYTVTATDANGNIVRTGVVEVQALVDLGTVRLGVRRGRIAFAIAKPQVFTNRDRMKSSVISGSTGNAKYRSQKLAGTAKVKGTYQFTVEFIASKTKKVLRRQYKYTVID